MKFKIGDRVRIVCRGSLDYGKEATVIGDARNRRTEIGWARLLYLVDVDGLGHIDPDNGKGIAFEPHDLEPLINPDEAAWQAFRDLHLKPDPALIMAKEPAKEEV